MSFEKLDQETLYHVAVEDFGVNVKPTDNKKVILAALVEDGVSWDDYLRVHPEAAGVEDGSQNPDYEPAAPGVITAGAMDPRGAVAEVVPHEPVVRTKTEEINVGTSDLYLIKMNRDNPYFEFRGYKFTQEHPYAVMPAADADSVLKEEEGFAIATPSEAAEYYSR